MKKILAYLTIFFLVATPTWSNAASYYAQSGSANMSAIEWDTTPAGGGTDLVWANRQAGDVFYANGKTGIAVNEDPGANGTVTLRTDAGSGTAGGGFTYATSLGLTLNVNIVAGTTVCLTVTGNTGSFTLSGDTTVTGGSSSNAYGIADQHTTGATVTIGSAGHPVTFTGGSALGTYGYYYTGAPGTATVYANSTGATGVGFGASIRGVTYIGNCTSAQSPGTATGCSFSASNTGTLTGKIIAGTSMIIGATGAFYYTPATDDYILLGKDSSYTSGTIDSHATKLSVSSGGASAYAY